jgi:hypothetical protein
MPANGESGQSTSILGGSPSNCRMEMTTSYGRRRPRRIERPTILTHSAQVSSVLARAGCTRTCPVGRAAGDVLRGCPTTTCSVPPTSCTPSRRGRHRGLPAVRALRKVGRQRWVRVDPGTLKSHEPVSGTTTNVLWRLGWSLANAQERRRCVSLRCHLLGGGHEVSQSSPRRRRGRRPPRGASFPGLGTHRGTG